MKIFLRKIWIFRGGGSDIFHLFINQYFLRKKTGEMALKIYKENVAIRYIAKKASLSVIIALKYLLKFSELSKT